MGKILKEETKEYREADMLAKIFFKEETKEF